MFSRKVLGTCNLKPILLTLNQVQTVGIFLNIKNSRNSFEHIRKTLGGS